MAGADEVLPLVSIDMDPLVESLTENLEEASGEGNVEVPWRIFRVPRSSDKDAEENAAYEPQYISIGPFHHGNEALQLMEPLKRTRARELLRGIDSCLMKKCIQSFAKEQARARERYNGHINLKPDEFAEMLVIDGCFIIEFLISYYCLGTQDATRTTNPNPPNERVPNEGEISAANPETSLLQDASTPATNSSNQQAGTRSLTRDDLFLLLRSDILYRLENQIPFFILEALYSQLSDGSIPKKEDGTKISLTDLALFYIHMGDENSPPFQPIPNHHVYHLLHLLHASQQPVTGSDKPNEGNTKPTETNLHYGVLAVLPLANQKHKANKNGRMQITMKRTSLEESQGCPKRNFGVFVQNSGPRTPPKVRPPKTGFPFHEHNREGKRPELFFAQSKMLRRKRKKKKKHCIFCTYGSRFFIEEAGRNDRETCTQDTDKVSQRAMTREKSVESKMIPCATDLRKAGINFDKKDTDNLLHVEFVKKGKLKIPVFSITEETACMLRNLIALEKYLPLQKRYFTSNAALMMNLMQTEGDVSILKTCGIIKSKMGSDGQVPPFILKLCKAGHFSYRNQCYEGLFNDLEHYYETPCSLFYRWMAALIPDFLTSPWAIPSFIVGSLLFFVTVLQNVDTLLSYF